ncbi:hypothetical protein PRK78_004227 [Emydomyces testavorans]|uniref:Uncharacterized protein n=1 Tax=Emydomyces testavorans TaxID=2070801 RepID=A0AAF0DID9_9EURO|nr:hypothetical protein PRK78_004227 [Emydomyces testavorans]
MFKRPVKGAEKRKWGSKPQKSSPMTLDICIDSSTALEARDRATFNWPVTKAGPRCTIHPRPLSSKQNKERRTEEVLARTKRQDHGRVEDRRGADVYLRIGRHIKGWTKGPQRAGQAEHEVSGS